MPKTQQGRKDSATLLKALAELEALHPKKIDLELGRIERVLKKLGNPQNKLPPTVHIAGTNGKGSTIAFLRAMAEAQNLKVHVYTSPHLVNFTERIVLAGQQVEEYILLEAIGRVRTANEGAHLSFFEATTAAAFLLFSETKADLLILETGLGGRYDATNVIAAPAAIGISPIDYDHAEFLGTDLASIAREKAGIFKPFVPVFSAPQSDLVGAILANEARKHQASFKIMNEDFQTYVQQGGLVFEDENALLDLPIPALRGQHQVQNAGLAIALARTLLIKDAAIAKGLGNVRWPARLQVITTGSLADITQDSGAELWLDGGHNPNAACAIAGTMAGLETDNAKPLVLITGMLASKDAPGFLDAFEGLASMLIAIPIEDHASLAPITLMDIAKGRSMKTSSAKNVKEAVKQACALDLDTPPRILICGSLYLAGQVLAL